MSMHELKVNKYCLRAVVSFMLVQLSGNENRNVLQYDVVYCVAIVMVLGSLTSFPHPFSVSPVFN